MENYTWFIWIKWNNELLWGISTAFSLLVVGKIIQSSFSNRISTEGKCVSLEDLRKKLLKK